MNRADFQKLAKLRVREARILLDNKCYEGAFYLAGYAVECALKACIAKKTKRYDFPPKDSSQLYNHGLGNLVALAGLKSDLDAEMASVKAFKDNWATVKDWKVDARYETKIAKNQAENLYAAITDDPNGVLLWLKNYW
ncbi:MAG: HEPN domain-containing protein [Pyrinomonadaceae bacterium]